MRPKPTIDRIFIHVAIALSAMMISGCELHQSPAPTEVRTPAVQSPTPLLPTATSEPLAAKVNGEGIPLAMFQAELQRFQAGEGKGLASSEQQQVVLDDLVDQVLLAQAAGKEGFTVSEAALQSRIDQLAAEMGGNQALAAWESKFGYTDDEFRWSLKLAMAAAWQRDKIAAQVPETMEQVHARQILVYNADQADKLLAQLKAGADFATIARQVDPQSGGDLGWFPRGYLTESAIEQAAFSLQPGQISEVIQTPLGYHIIQVIERDPQRPLSPDARLALQKQALQKWMEEQRKQSEIEVLMR